ncbi:hypothetical protein [Streptomyces sp. NPDC059802]|uniref:hypothetical protein n=1 Tax=Streptomyces sp. NPDC059802 TaxID=3346952 RepID=UPI003669274D
MYVAVTTGVLCATVQAALLKGWLTAYQMTGWGWRIPFVIGALLGIYAFYLRRGLVENHAFREARQDDSAGRPSLVTGIWENRRAVLQVVGLSLGGTVL